MDLQEGKRCSKIISTNNKLFESTSGITLIALIVTIIVLIILATISINGILGENGLIKRTEMARDKTRVATIQEQIDLWKLEKNMSNYEGSSSSKTIIEFIDDLESNGHITNGEKEEILTDHQLTIGNEEPIIFPFDLTLGEVYSDDMIGQKLTYTADGQEEWIVFGKDISGNILITTELPIDNGFNLKGGASAWLTYESDLNTACSGYGSTIQGKTVLSRSITMDDINYVAGFTKPTFDTYSFGTTQDYDNKKVNYYYPSLSASENGYWKQPASEGEITFEDNWYRYYCDWETGEYVYYGADIDGDKISASDRNIKTDNCKYIWGGNTEETCYNPYVVASRSVFVYSDYANFRVDYVGYGEVYSGNYNLCNSDASGGYDDDDIGSCGIRPVVVLPSSILVEENKEIYDIAY